MKNYKHMVASMFNTMLSLAFFGLPMAIHASTTNITIVKTYSCGTGATNVSCEYTGSGLNAVGDIVYWNTRNVPLNSIGTIDKQKTVAVTMPHNNEKVLYSFTPTKGMPKVKNKLVKMLMVAFSLKNSAPMAGSPKNIEKELAVAKDQFPKAVSIIKIYGQLEGISQWVEVLSIPHQESDSAQLGRASITIEPTGTITFPYMNDGKQEAEVIPMDKLLTTLLS